MTPLRFQTTPVIEENSIVPVAVEEEITPWENEPKTVQELLDRYIVEAKFTSSVAGGMLYLTQAQCRDNTAVDTVPNQRYKLFFVAWYS